MSNTIRLAIEVSRYMRRVMRELFQDGAGIPIGSSSFITEGDGGIIDELSPDSAAWEWVNAVLMLLRAVDGILENAEDEINEQDL